MAISRGLRGGQGPHFESVRKDAKKLANTLPGTSQPHCLRPRKAKFARLVLLARESYGRAKRLRGGIDNDDLLLLTRDLLKKAIRRRPGVFVQVDRPRARR